MKSIKSKLLFFGFALVQAGVHAQTMNSTAMSAPSSAANGGNQDSHQSITFNSPAESRQLIEYSGTQTIKNVPSVAGPPLTTSNDTCMGSTSGGINGPGFGLSIGSTWADGNCKLLKNSRELWNMGMKAAAMALMCTDSANREALELTGFECPQTTRDKTGNSKVARSTLSAPSVALSPVSLPPALPIKTIEAATTPPLQTVPAVVTAGVGIEAASPADAMAVQKAPTVTPAAYLLPAVPISLVTPAGAANAAVVASPITPAAAIVAVEIPAMAASIAPTPDTPVISIIPNAAQLDYK